MLRQVWHVLVVSLLLSISINAQGHSKPAVFPSTFGKGDVTAFDKLLSIPITKLETTTPVSESTSTVSETTTTSESTSTISESATTTTEQTTTTSESTSTTSESTTTASESTTGSSESTTTDSESTTTASESTTTASESTTSASESTTNGSESTTTDSEPATTVSESTTGTSESTTNGSESTTTDSEPTTTASESTTSASESTTTDSEPTTTASESTTESETTESVDNQTDEPSTTNVLKTLMTETLDLNSMANGTAKPENAPVHEESHGFNDYFPHADKPQWIHTNPSKPISLHKDIPSPSDELIGEITRLLAEYISNQTSDSSAELSSSGTDLIATELQDKLDQSGLNIDDADRAAIRGTVKLVIKNLPLMIQAIVSNIGEAGEDNCPLKFTFYNNMYCVNFEVDVASTPSPTIPSLVETTTTTNLPANVSIESFHVSNTDDADKLPTTWQQWLAPSPAQDQASFSPNEPAVVCYYTNWAQYRNGPGRFYPENIDPNLCTHIVYAFAKLEDGVIAPYEWNDESTPWSTGMYARMMNLRKNKRPKILLAIGGWNHGSGKFSDMVQDKTKRATFVTTTIIFLQKHNFDGLDLDWEYPGSREGSRPTDKANFVSLIVELKKAFRPHSLLLTAAVGAGKPTIDAGYDIPKVCENLDLVNLMAYDLHGSWETETGLNAPLFARQNDTTQNKQLTVDWAVRYWLDKGCSPSKLVLGLALYGRTFRLASSLNNKIGASAVGPGSAGLNTGEGGFLAYYEICTRVQQQSWTKVFDDEQKSNYAYRGVEWVGYDDAYSIGFKVQYAMDMGLAGIMFWAPDLDDFAGTSCNDGKYPLMNTAVDLVRGKTKLNTSTESPTLPTPPTTTPTTLQGGKRVVCYYTNWAQYRPDEGKFVPEDLDASLCTHIIFAFAILKDSKLAPFEWNDEDTEWSKGMYSRIMALKKTNKVKILLAVGGWNFGSGPFSDMVGDERLRKEFVQQATQYIRDHQFDGLDLDWEFPGGREGSRPRDKQLFTVLVKELKAALQPYNLLLTAAVGAGAETIENGYEIDQLAPHLDFINLMTYDLHGGAWENVTGLHTALYARREERGNEMTLNQNWAVNYFLQQGMPKEKITMGLATYGRTFELANSSKTGVGAPGSGPGAPGRFTREPGFLAYYEICEKLNSNQWKSKFDDVQKSMYAYGEDMWVGYDNVDTMIIRANYIIGKDLGGVMIWAPDLDDFSGKFCNQGRYPLMNTVVNLIRMGTIVPIYIPTVPTSTKTTSTSTSSLPSPPSTATPPSVVCMTTVNPFVFQTVDVKLCSHLILVETNTNADVSQSALSSDTLQQLKTMRKDNTNLKIFYSMLGRWKATHFDLIRDDQSRRKLNQQIKQYLIDNQLDGFDIDWNIQADQITSAMDKSQLSTWLSELRTDFDDSQLSLSIGISGDETVLDNSYEFNQISSTVDFLRLMAFDWPSKNVTSLINPLFPVNNDPINNINWAVDYLLTHGVLPEQISLGIPTHGRWFGLANRDDHSVGSPVIGSSMLVAYSDICKLIEGSGYIKAYDRNGRSSYTYNLRKKQWISSDTVNDVALKARFAKLAGLGGVTLSAIGMDDVDGQCGQGPYPLLHAVSNIFNAKKTNGSKSKNIDDRSSPLKQKNVFCSVSPKAEDHSDVVAFTLDQIGTDLCTHLLIDHQSSLLSASMADQLKNTHSDLKILLTFNADEFEDNNQWKGELKKKKADGLNLQINSDTFSNETAKLIQSIRAVLPDQSLFTISFQLPSIPSQQASFFDVLQLHSSVDYMFILPFDEKSIQTFNTIQPWNSLATFVPANSDQNIGDFSMISILLFIISAGVPKEKIIPGIPAFGLTFQLGNQNKYQIGDTITGPGFPGRVTDREGLLSSYEICEHIEADEYQRFLSNDSIIVLAHHKTDLITFDDTVPLQLNQTTTVNGTVELKAMFIKNAEFGGVLVHAIDMDDYTGSSCHRGTFPITSVVSRVFSISIPTTSSSPPPPSTTVPGVQKVNPCAEAKSKDLIADETDCRYYYVCMPDHEEPVAHLQCPSNMHFSPKQKACSQEQFPCTPKSKFNQSKPSTEVPLTTAETPFVCPAPTGIFPDPSDCSRFLACSSNIVLAMKCPLKTKFNPQSNQCDWTSNSCP